MLLQSGEPFQSKWVPNEKRRVTKYYCRKVCLYHGINKVSINVQMKLDLQDQK